MYADRTDHCRIWEDILEIGYILRCAETLLHTGFPTEFVRGLLFPVVRERCWVIYICMPKIVTTPRGGTLPNF